MSVQGPCGVQTADPAPRCNLFLVGAGRRDGECADVIWAQRAVGVLHRLCSVLGSAGTRSFEPGERASTDLPCSCCGSSPVHPGTGATAQPGGRIMESFWLETTLKMIKSSH